ncbi:MAG TPA: ATP-binding protein [Thermoanaerobaculia bacterium]|jgi:signal transduction histidine kinase/FixJ family two-component response regulator|nr:ATP-binding protein [Thermoanaerobaculia bacterium]
MPATAPAGESESRFRRVELPGLANGICLLALALLIPGLPSSLPVTIPLVIAFLACVANALRLRRRFLATLDHEVERCKRAEQEARAADLAKGRFLANVSHEIRTPMSAILGLTELLLGSGLGPPQREQVELVRTSAEALLTLVDDILDLARVEAGRLLLRPRDFRLQELTGNVVRLLAPQAEERGIDLRLEVAPRVPDGLNGDTVRLRQVLLNLVGNAVRCTRKGSVTVRVEVEQPATAPSTIRFEVRDTGVGIRPEDQERLFQPFAQADSAASRHLEGTGLGLVISKNVVELMGGEIGFESTRGVGSTFWFRIPLVRAQGSGLPSWTPLGEAGQILRRKDRRELRVLVVDDRAPNRAVAVALLSGLGYTPEAVESGEEALDLLARQPFDAVLLDSEMPGFDGCETCRQLRRMEKDGRRVPVIAVTAHARAEEREACFAAGMDDFLVKPFHAADLAACLDLWLGANAADTADSLEERLAALKALSAGTGPGTGVDIGTQVIEAFLQQGENDLATLRRAILQEDPHALAEAAHGLSGSAAVLGARDLAASAGELAVLARGGDLAACAARLSRVEHDYRDAAARMR